MSFQYTSGDPSHLTGGAGASMADIQGPFTDLKTFLNARIAAIPTLVSSLPASPTDGQEVHYLADATNGVVWHLRYRAASASTFKWEFVGGANLYAEVTTSESTASAVFTDLATVGPSITVPLAGDYFVAVEAISSNTTVNAPNLMSYAIGATAANVADQAQVNWSTGAQLFQRRERRKAGLAASTALVAKYATSSGAGASFANRTMTVRPVRVG